MNLQYSVQIGDQLFDYTDPYAHSPNLCDAVAGISKVARFGGHTKAFYSVAQHSVFVSVLADADGCAWSGLAHDLAEAYYGDFPSPLKAFIRSSCPMLMARLNTIDCVIEDAFLFDPKLPGVKRADLVALVTERRDLVSKGGADVAESWATFNAIRPSDYVISPLSPEKAEKAWWRRYYQLLDQGKAPKFPGTPQRSWCDDTK